MDTSQKDGSTSSEDGILNPIHSGVSHFLWRPLALAFKEYSGPLNGHQRGRTPMNRMKKALVVLVNRPLVVKLTKDIIETYQTCNPTFIYLESFNPKRYLTNPSTVVSNDGLDNENSDMVLAVNDVLINKDVNHRYIVKDLLGQGTFGQVVKCWADEKNCFVAVKVIKNQPAYYHQALVEISILNMLNHKYDPEDKHHIVRILDHFLYHGHLCIVFEMLGVNLYELLKVNSLRGISLNLLRLFTKQILAALIVLRDASVIHCDLKPENILLTTSLQSAEIKLIDFGSACLENRTVYSYIQSRFYRSPEVVLGHPYNTTIDMWSFGCVAAELFLGLPLFPAASQYDLLQRVIDILGSYPPDHILRNAKNTNKYFKHVGAPARQEENHGEGLRSAFQFLGLAEYESRQTEQPTIGKRYFEGNLEQLITNYPSRKKMSQEEIEKEYGSRFVFIDFLKGLLHLDPQQRWTPRQAAQHPFVTEDPFDGPFKPPAEAPRLPIPHGMNVEHNPVAGHWFGAGLSPQVVNLNVGFLQYGSPQYQGDAFSYASSYGSVGSYGSFDGGGGGLGSSYGSYGDTSGLYTGYGTTSAISNANFGVSPDTWRRIGQAPPSAFGHAHLGMSPSRNFFRPMSLGASPSQFTPPSSQFQASPGSPSTGSSSRYGPTSPARGGAGVTALGKAAAVGQFNRRRGPALSINSASGHNSPQENTVAPWQVVYSNSVNVSEDIGASSHQEGNARPGYLGSPRNTSVQGAHPASVWRQRNGTMSGAPHSKSSSMYSPGSFGAILSTLEANSDGVEDASPPPDPADWDPNYSEEQLLQEDGGELVSPSSASHVGLPTIGSVGVRSGPGPSMNMGPNGKLNHNYVQLQGGSSDGVLSSSSLHGLQTGYGRKQFYHGPFSSQQNSPSRLGQQPSQLLQQQLHYQFYAPSLQSPDQPMQLSPVALQQPNQHYHTYFQSPDQSVHLHPYVHNHANGDAGSRVASGLLPSPLCEGRGTLVVGNTGLHVAVGYDSHANLGTGHHGVFKPSYGIHPQDHIQDYPSQLVSGIPLSQRHPIESYGGRRTGPSNVFLPPASGRKDRRAGL
eukprot:c28917_g1_i3 orf=630-3857(+)